jgi:hypothetical protein
MGVAYNSSIVTNGLVLALDAGNTKSLNIPSQSDHGYADWYCLVSGTATYSIINQTGGIIYERNGATITALVTASTPQRGTITITAGRTYYGSVPVNLVVEDGHQCIAPLTMSGTQFWNVIAREVPSTYYVYSPYQTATVNFYDNTAGGLTGTPTSTITVNANGTGTFTSNNLTNHWISSNVPIIATVTQINGADKTILSPMSTYVYQRFQNNIATTNFTTPTNNNLYVTYDSTYKVMNMSIADGSGYDCAQGLGLEYLSDTYSWGNVVSDYTMVFPYNGTFTASYWSGSAWVVWDTHTITTGSITNPPRVTRDGTNGPGVEASAIQGAAANMASGATLWKWEGNVPFYLNINDSADDEFSVLGWNSSTQTTPRSGNTITDISGRGNNGTLFNGPVYVKDNLGALSFDGIDDYVNLGTFFNYTNFTISLWVYPGSTQVQYADIFDNNHTGNQNFVCQQNVSNTNQYSFACLNATNASGTGLFTLTANTWTFLTFTWNNSIASAYINGAFHSSGSAANPINYSSQYLRLGTWGGGGRNWNGRMSNFVAHNRVLTASEIQQNFNALRGRYGI